MAKHVIKSDDAPGALGPYNQAILAGELLFCSGQVGIDPARGEMVSNKVEEQARQVLRNLTAVLAAADMSLANVVKTTIYLASMDDFQTVNAVYGEFFPTDPPARATVEVSRLPIDALVEIDAIARR